MKITLYTILVAFLLQALPALAERPYREYREDKGKRQSISREQAARIARERNGGRILDIRPRGNGYEVKTLRNGRVRVYEILEDENKERRR